MISEQLFAPFHFARGILANFQREQAIQDFLPLFKCFQRKIFFLNRNSKEGYLFMVFKDLSNSLAQNVFLKFEAGIDFPNMNAVGNLFVPTSHLTVTAKRLILKCCALKRSSLKHLFFSKLFFQYQIEEECETWKVWYSYFSWLGFMSDCSKPGYWKSTILRETQWLYCFL